MEAEQEIQQKYGQFQMLQKQIEKVSEHLQMFNQQLQELEISKNALQQLSKTDKGTEILAPVANGIFLKADLKDTEKLIVNVGSDTTVEKTIPQVVEMLEKQRKKISEQVTTGESVLQDMNQQAMQIYQSVEQMMQDSEKEEN